MPRFDLVILDFDGTLADTAAWFRGTINQVARRFAFREVSDEDFERLRGADIATIIRFLGVPTWKIPRIADHLRRLAAEDVDQLKPFPGTAGLLQRLADAGILIAVVSSNTEANVRTILGEASAGLVDFYGCGASLFGKAAKFRAVVRRSGIAADRVLAVGDEGRDIDAARAAAVAAGAVTWGYATADLLRSLDPDFLFETPNAIGDTAIG